MHKLHLDVDGPWTFSRDTSTDTTIFIHISLLDVKTAHKRWLQVVGGHTKQMVHVGPVTTTLNRLGLLFRNGLRLTRRERVPIGSVDLAQYSANCPSILDIHGQKVNQPYNSSGSG